MEENNQVKEPELNKQLNKWRLISNHKNPIIILISVILIVLVISFIVTNQRTRNKRKKLDDYIVVSCFSKLETIGKNIDRYQKTHNGSNPPTLNILDLPSQEEMISRTTLPVLKQKIKNCRYVYRGSDLDVNAEPNMILIYDKHCDVYHILLAKPKLIFKIGKYEVTEAKYMEFCRNCFKTYDPNIIFHVKEDRFGRYAHPGYIEYDCSTLEKEQYFELADEILNSKKLIITILKKSKDLNNSSSLAFIEQRRVMGVNKKLFQEFINQDNKLRKKAGLPEKSASK